LFCSSHHNHTYIFVGRLYRPCLQALCLYMQNSEKYGVWTLNWNSSRWSLQHTALTFSLIFELKFVFKRNNYSFLFIVIVQSPTSLFPDRFSPNSTATLPFTNWFWKCTWFRFRYVQSTTSLFPDRFLPNSTATLPFVNQIWKCTWFKFRYVQSTTSLFPDRVSPNSTATLPFANQFENLPDSGSGMSRAQLPYSPTNFHQIRHEPYPLRTDFENVPDSGTGTSKVQLPYSPTDFHQIRHQPYPLPINLKIYLIQIQTWPAKRVRNRLVTL